MEAQEVEYTSTPAEFVIDDKTPQLNFIEPLTGLQDVRVIKATKTGDGLNAITSFEISTKAASLPQEVVVSRRYKDFQWLHAKLCEDFKGVFVPALPEKSSVLDTFVSNLGIVNDPYQTAILEKRRRGMEKFLKRLIAHPVLSKSTQLASFLNPSVQIETDKDTDAQIKKFFGAIEDKVNSAAKETEYAARALKKGNAPFSRGLEKIRDEPFSKEIESRRHALAQVELVLSKLSKTLEKWIKERYDLTAVLMEVSVGFKALAAVDVSLAPTHRAMSSCLDLLQQLSREQIQTEDVNLLEPLQTSLNDSISAKAAFRARDEALHSYELACAELEASINERAKASIATESGTPSGPPKGLRSLLERMNMIADPDTQARLRDQAITDAQELVDREKRSWEEVSERVLTESTRVEQERSADLKEAIRLTAHANIEMLQRSLVAWQSVLSVVEPPGSGTPSQPAAALPVPIESSPSSPRDGVI